MPSTGSAGNLDSTGEAIACRWGMLGTLVEYLHNARVPFRLASYPSEEERPIAGHPIPARGILVDTRLFVVDGRAVLAAFPASEGVDLAAISTALGGIVAPATRDELPAEFRRATGPVPPFGQLFGVPIVLDARVAGAATIVFRAFGESVYFEIPYDEWARLEQPRLAPFASAGELAAAPPA
jgi:prolyl-tRNA editing enzyme YbaK/EbsC (Cys-tRNA(Pro) deacylase)